MYSIDEYLLRYLDCLDCNESDILRRALKQKLANSNMTLREKALIPSLAENVNVNCEVPPVVIICGGTHSNTDKQALKLITYGLRTHQWRIYISGGTDAGVCRAVADARKFSKNIYLIGFVPSKNFIGSVSKDYVALASNYDSFRYSNNDDFSFEEVEAYWRFIEQELRITGDKVLVVSTAGSEITRQELEHAFMKKARFILITGAGGATDSFSNKHKDNSRVYDLNKYVSYRDVQSRLRKLL